MTHDAAWNDIRTNLVNRYGSRCVETGMLDHFADEVQARREAEDSRLKWIDEYSGAAAKHRNETAGLERRLSILLTALKLTRTVLGGAAMWVVPYKNASARQIKVADACMAARAAVVAAIAAEEEAIKKGGA